MSDKTQEESEQRLLQAQAGERQREILQQLGKGYEAHLETEMGRLHEQFVVFISTSGLPLPQVLLVLQILVHETVEQAAEKYLRDS